jgi:hypothetical protein
MSTTPVVPQPEPPVSPTPVAAPTPTKVITVEKPGTFLTPGHLILTGLLLLATFGCAYLYGSRRAEIADAKVKVVTAVEAQFKKDAQQAEIVASDNDKQNKALQAKSAEQLAQLEVDNDQLLQANKKLVAAISLSNQQLANQKKLDSTLTPTDQSKRWQALVPNATVTPTSSGFTIDAQGGLLTIQDLEALPIYAVEVKDLQSELTNDDTRIATDAQALAIETQAHKSDLVNSSLLLAASRLEISQAKAETAVVQAKLNAQKKATMRTRLRWFGAGFVTGIVTTVVAVVK